MIQGISHITLIVKDLDKSMHFFKSIFNAVEIYSSGHKTFSFSNEKFFTINDIWFAIMEGEPVERSYNHIAFKVSEVDFPRYVDKLKDLNIKIKSGRSRKQEEGNFIYFYDYDNHLFEIHCGTLKERLKYYSQTKSDQSSESGTPITKEK